ncbi:MAG: invasion associated locus B family protein [Pseudomonadota bacterium]
MKYRPLVAAVLLLGLALPASATAAEQTFVATYRDWSLFTYEDGDSRLCFIASEPKARDGNYTRRGDPALLVTRLPGEADSAEVSMQPGYTFQEGSTVRVVVDGNRSFEMFTQGEYAWTRSPADDRALIAAMRAGIELMARGTSSRDTWSEDTYSLLGFTAAFNALEQACRQ